MVDTEETNGSVLERMKLKAKEVQDSVKDKISEVSEAGQEKIKEMIDGVNEILPAIRELGYSVEGINISIGLIPDITIEVGGLSKTIQDAKYQQILEEHKDRKLLISVIKTLQTTSSMQQKIGFMQMHSDNASITLGLPPKISLKFKKDV